MYPLPQNKLCSEGLLFKSVVWNLECFSLTKNNLVDDNSLYILPVAYNLKSNCFYSKLDVEFQLRKLLFFGPLQIHKNNMHI